MNPFPVEHTDEPVGAPTPLAPPTPNTSDPLEARPIIASPAPASPVVLDPPKYFIVGTYLPEYIVQLVLLLIIVGSITSLIGIGIDNLIPAEKSSGDSYGTQISSFQLVWSLAGLLSALPFFGWLFWRTRKAEAANPDVRNHKWRRGALGFFLVIQGLAIVSSLNGMLFDLIGRAVDVDSLGLLSYFSSGEKGPWYETVVITVLSIAVISFVVFAMSRDYRKDED